MDRDNRWERVEKAYRAMTHGQAETKSADPIAALKKSYEQGTTDEFVLPVVITTGPEPTAAPVGLIRDDDAVIFFNFRADRARQMTKALMAPDFDGFVDAERPKNLFFVGMTQYEKTWTWLQYVIGAGEAGAHSGECVRGAAIQEFARGGDGEIRARDLFLQWRRGEAVSRRGARAGAVAESADLRFEAGDERGGNHGCGD